MHGIGLVHAMFQLCRRRWQNRCRAASHDRKCVLITCPTLALACEAAHVLVCMTIFLSSGKDCQQMCAVADWSLMRMLMQLTECHTIARGGPIL